MVGAIPTDLAQLEIFQGEAKPAACDVCHNIAVIWPYPPEILDGNCVKCLPVHAKCIAGGRRGKNRSFLTRLTHSQSFFQNL